MKSLLQSIQRFCHISTNNGIENQATTFQRWRALLPSLLLQLAHSGVESRLWVFTNEHPDLGSTNGVLGVVR